MDEAYIDFGGVSALPLIEKYDNLLIVQTFSKSRSMAGMRIGYAMGNAKLIRYINDVKYSFNSYTMNRTALVLGVEAIRDRAYFEETRKKIIETREWTKKELRALGFTFGVREAILSLLRTSACRQQNCSRRCAGSISMCAILRRNASTTTCVSASEREKRWRRLFGS